MIVSNWISDNYIEIFGAITGIIYVFLEIRQNIWLWPVGLVTSAVYIMVFYTSKFYADMSLQGYYLVISAVGWYWWRRGLGEGQRAQGKKQGAKGALEQWRKDSKEEEVKGRDGEGEKGRGGALETGDRRTETEETRGLVVSRLKLKTGLIMGAVFVFFYFVMWLVLTELTDSPVPEWDAFITSLSIVATWMLARKIYEHWYLWIIVNFVSAVLFVIRGLYPTVILYLIYGIMSFAGLVEWKKTIN